MRTGIFRLGWQRSTPTQIIRIRETIATADSRSNGSFCEVGTEAVVFIDREPMTRACIGETLASYLPERRVEPISGPARPWRTSKSGEHFPDDSQRTPSGVTGGVARHLKEIDALAPGRPIVIMSHRAEAASRM